MTAAIDAVHLQLNRHLMDLKAREKILKKSVVRANERLGCACDPSAWTFDTMGLREVHTFFSLKDPDPEEIFRPTGLRYVGALRQSRIFAHLELFELALPAVADNLTLSASDLRAFEQRHGPGVQAAFIDSSSPDVWESRKQSVVAFLEAARRAVDIVRLSVLTGPCATPPSDGLWESQGTREFHATPGLWITAEVYEANSAQLDKVRRWLRTPNRA